MAGFALTPGTNLVTSGPAHKAVLRLALPTVAAMLTQSVVNEIDIVFFARLPCPESSNAQAALLPACGPADAAFPLQAGSPHRLLSHGAASA